jgi:predicted DNA-binding transcriptional regulator YafY
MPRNNELIRQWEILRSLDATPTGVSIRRLASERKVHQRTIRRDLVALEEAGFPLSVDREAATPRYRLTNRPFQRLTRLGFGVSELCALYMSRSMIDALAALPLRDDLARALAKIEETLPDGVRRFLDQLPGVLHAKMGPGKRRDARRMRELIPRVMESILERKRVAMRYHSFSSGRIKDYVIEPYRLTYAQGGMYLAAWVPQYEQVRTFAVERILTYAETGEHFSATQKLPEKPFQHSLGVNTGEPVRVELEFDRRIAAYVAECDWHESQRITERPDGSLAMTLDVCVDPALKSFILSFGPLARIVAPGSLAEEILEELEEAREQYAPRMAFEAAAAPLYGTQPPRLPFSRPS